jgi:two-component system cell cycle response regulator CpdR
MAKILVIDDEASVLAVIERALKRAGHKVVLATDGASGIRSYEQEPADLVISDIYMPDYDGIELISRFRRASPTLPIIAMSGHQKGNILEVAKRLGVVAVIEKPFDVNDFVNAVDNAVKDCSSA